MRRARDCPQELADIVTQHIAELQIAANGSTSDAHSPGAPTAALAQDKVSNVVGIELLRDNLAVAKLLNKQSANDLDPLLPCRVRQTADIAHVPIEICQLTADVILLLRKRNLALSAKYTQEMTNGDAQLVTQFANWRAARARRQMLVEKLLLRSFIDQHEAQARFGNPLREVGDTGQIHAHGVGMISACSKLGDILIFD
ncbi:hypothetical protein GCM10011497_19900 [Elstera cyanobacteriorum]|nr:hypothetical protein GCM10011497_19900 [Elstera cyanobacteriorum]